LERQVARLRALEDLVDVCRRAPGIVPHVWPVAQEPARFGVPAVEAYRGQPMFERLGRNQPRLLIRAATPSLTEGAGLGEGGRQPTHGPRYSPWTGKMCWWISRTWRMAYSSAHCRVSGGSSMGASQSRRLLSPCADRSLWQARGISAGSSTPLM